MTEYDNTNKGVLFRNEKKENPNHPDHSGSINIEGKEYWLNAWIKMSQKGTKFFSLSVKQKDQMAAPKQAQMTEKEIDDEIPF